MKKLILILALTILLFAFFSCADGEEIDTGTDTFVNTEEVTESEAVTEIETDEVTPNITETAAETETEAMTEEPISEIPVPEGYNLLWALVSIEDYSCNKTIYSYDAKGRLTSIELYNAEEVLYGESDFMYENDELKSIELDYVAGDDEICFLENGRPSEFRQYNSYSFESDTLINYEYNDKGQLVRMGYRGVSYDETIYPEHGYREFSYDDNGNVISDKEYEYHYFYHHYKYKYDKNGNMVAEYSYDENGTLLWHRTYAYNQKGECVLTVSSYNKEFGMTVSEYTYEKDCSILTHTRYYPDGKIATGGAERYFTYDKRGNIIGTSYYTGGKLWSSTVFEYDEYSNLILRKNGDNKPSRYEYKYFILTDEELSEALYIMNLLNTDIFYSLGRIGAPLMSPEIMGIDWTYNS